MIKIILGDDDTFLLSLEKDKLNEEILYSKIQAEIVCIASNGTEILNFINKQKEFYLCFLDLDFGDGKLNGIDIARQIKSISPESKIVFVTNHEEMALKVLKSGVEPFGFLEKTKDMQSLRAGYRKYLQLADHVMHKKQSIPDGQEIDNIILNMGFDETITLVKRNITYVETEPNISHGITFHTADGSHITIRGSILQAAEELGPDFVKCHRSILVNMFHMIGMEKDNIKLSTGELVPCSFRLKNEMKKIITTRSIE